MYQVCWGRISSCEEANGIPMILRLLGRISSVEKRTGDFNLGYKIKTIKMMVGKNIKL